MLRRCTTTPRSTSRFGGVVVPPMWSGTGGRQFTPRSPNEAGRGRGEGFGGISGLGPQHGDLLEYNAVILYIYTRFEISEMRIPEVCKPSLCVNYIYPIVSFLQSTSGLHTHMNVSVVVKCPIAASASHKMACKVLNFQ